MSQIHSITPPSRPAFLHLFIWNWAASLPVLQQVMKKLGANYVAVRPDSLAALYRQYMAREKLLLAAPQQAAAIAGMPLQLTVRVQNVTRHSTTAHVSLVSGLREAKITPATINLDSAEATKVQVSGVFAGAEATLEAAGAGVMRTMRITVRQVSPEEILGGLPPALAGQSMAYMDHFAATGLSHGSGVSVPDSDAISGAAWQASSSTAQPGYIIYGPYQPEPAGRYLALFRLKRIGKGPGPAAMVDVCVGGGTPDLASATIQSENLPLNEYEYVPVVFTNPGSPIETRVQWTGNAPIQVDGVDLWRIGG